MHNTNKRTVLLAKMALMTAIAYICALIHFPILPGATFLEFEVSDIPILISGFAFGPLPGLLIAAASIILHDITLGASSGPYGTIMHMIAIGVFVLVSGFIYGGNKTKKRAVTGLICGGIALVVVMIPANLFITPLFMGVPRDAVIAMLAFPIIPFNLIKAVINAVVVFLLYKRLSPFLHRTDRF